MRAANILPKTARGMQRVARLFGVTDQTGKTKNSVDRLSIIDAEQPAKAS